MFKFGKKKSKHIQYDKTGRELITVLKPKSPISEQYRTIRTNLEFTAVDDDLQTMVITSASSGEGKSTTSSNLAVVYAQQGKRVLLVDCDMRRPTAHFTFRLSNGIGLSTVLAKKTTVEKATHSTQIENLDLIAAGPIPPNPSELLSSKMMDRVLEELRANYDIVILDAPPMMQVADTRLLARKVDGVVLVVGCDKSDRQMVVKAKEQLTLAEAHILGVVLNKREPQGSDDYYYYYAYE
ncbi:MULTISPECIES: CpsD/CapB family tyrosine-protein kinase [Exiguobacterium]|uniref:CpsD/CapB family tyrosine-protein kinase n=1 Tax=Exiguobacterium TaxID=33986 RepID=UPI001BE79DFF|nr:MULTISPECIES: CpsD/CapB family tyrosine-protein kinase [Exiguobacterium]MCT4777078.1 CpsD/CapB family tyrosine-protein kinase [Exiguobacterium aquaticum]MCT4789971.1 CpsD/CapB family tyrosine-protein kinase [Exiguobacterium mexicanum]